MVTHLAVTLDGDVLRQCLPLPQYEILAAGLSVEHLVPYPRVELVRVGLSCFVKLESYLSVHTQGKIVVDRVQGQLVHALVADLDTALGVETKSQPPPVHVYHLGVLETLEDLAQGFIRVAAAPSLKQYYD